MGDLEPLTVYVQPMGEARHGLWCDDCLKPARVESDLMTLSMDGVSPLGVFSMCTECGLPGTLNGQHGWHEAD